MLRPYFSLDNGRAINCFNKLYGITFEKLEGMPIYHKDVVVLSLTQINSILQFYKDFHPRAQNEAALGALLL